MKCTCAIVLSSWPAFYALHGTRLHRSVTFAALYLLQRLKAHFLAAFIAYTLHHTHPSVTFVALYLLQCLKAHFSAAFTTYTLCRTRLHPSVTFAALYLLQHLKVCNYFGIHASLQDHLRRHLFVGCCQSRHPSPGPLTLHSSPCNVPSTSSTSKGMLPSHPCSPPCLLTHLSAQ